MASYTCSVYPGNVNVVGEPPVKVEARAPDADFWKVFDFKFIDGRPYDDAAFESGLQVMVITKSVARKLFGSTDVTGREILFNYAPYTVPGEVSRTKKNGWPVLPEISHVPFLPATVPTSTIYATNATAVWPNTTRLSLPPTGRLYREAVLTTRRQAR